MRLTSTTISIIVTITSPTYLGFGSVAALLFESHRLSCEKKKFNFWLTGYLLSISISIPITSGTGSEVAANCQTRDWKIEKHYCLMYVSPGKPLILLLQLIKNVDLSVKKPSSRTTTTLHRPDNELWCVRSYNDDTRTLQCS